MKVTIRDPGYGLEDFYLDVYGVSVLGTILIFCLIAMRNMV